MQNYMEDKRFDIYLPYLSLGLQNQSLYVTIKHGSSMQEYFIFLFPCLPVKTLKRG